MADHVYVKFGDPSSIRFWDIVWEKIHKQMDVRINAAECPTQATAVTDVFLALISIRVQ